MRFLNRIKSARPLGDHRLKLVFADGYVAEIDLAPALKGPVFEPLKDFNYFERVRVEDYTVRWPNDADFDPDVLRYWCEAGGVQSREQTDAWFTREPASKSA
jgi:hypothetical protein